MYKLPFWLLTETVVKGANRVEARLFVSKIKLKGTLYRVKKFLFLSRSSEVEVTFSVTVSTPERPSVKERPNGRGSGRLNQPEFV